MTKELFDKKIKSMSHMIFFNIENHNLQMLYWPYQYEDGTWGYKKISISENEEQTNEIVWYNSLDEMLDNYLIDGVPLGELLDKVENMRCVYCG